MEHVVDLDVDVVVLPVVADHVHVVVGTVAFADVVEAVVWASLASEPPQDGIVPVVLERVVLGVDVVVFAVVELARYVVGAVAVADVVAAVV